MSGLGALLGQRLRRDRLQVPMWIAATALLAWAGHAGVTQSYATEADRREVLGAALANPVILMFRGLPSGAGEGAFVAFEILPWLAILSALMSTFLAVRHTRADEEAGRAELVSATPAGRTTPVAATIVHGALADSALGLLSALALLSTGLDARGCWLTGAAAAATGVVFLGVALIGAQLVRTSRSANAIAVWALVACFLLRGIGNAGGTPADDLTHTTSAWPAWASPFGWAEQTRPFDADTWWPVLLALLAGLALTASAVALQSVRDAGASFLPGRPGRAHARRALGSSHALVWRLASGSIAGWAAGGALTGILSATLGRVVDQVAGQNPAVVDVITKIARTGALDEAVISVFFTVLGVVAACCAAQTIIRARQEELHGTAEPVLAAAVGRVRWLADHLVVATSAVLIVVAAAVLAAGIGVASGDGSPDLYRTVLVEGAGQAVAASVFTVVAALVFVVAPRATIGLVWALLLVATMLGLFGPLFGMPEWTANLSPFGLTPVVSQGDVDARGVWWLLVAVVAGAAASVALMRRRQVPSSG